MGKGKGREGKEGSGEVGKGEGKIEKRRGEKDPPLCIGMGPPND